MLAGIHAGRSSRAISEFNRLLASFVHKRKRKLEVSESPEDVNTKRGKPGLRSDNVRTPDFVAKGQQMVE